MPDPQPVQIPDARRLEHVQWLKDLTRVPTAAGREDRVAAWVRAWAQEREGIRVEEDRAGNLTLRLDIPDTGGRVVYFTAHMDHPAMVVERVVAPGVFELSLRGGVMPDYLQTTRLEVIDRNGASLPAVLTERSTSEADPFPLYLAQTETDAPDSVTVGDIARWYLDEPFERDGLWHANACDDLAALAAALCALDTLRLRRIAGEQTDDVRVLLTRAEEVGFVGAIAACRLGTIPAHAHVLALETSRSFPDSPIGGGPIVRVGDRMSTFSPTLTAACCKAAEQVFGRPAQPRASEKEADLPGRPWQRKLMAGGACEATVFCAFGLDATCLCLPLGNYHNMADLAAMQAGTLTGTPRLAHEYIAIADYHGLIDLLVHCGWNLPPSSSVMDRLDLIWQQRASVLGRSL